MQSSSSVFDDIDAIIARAMAECGVEAPSPTPAETPEWEEIKPVENAVDTIPNNIHAEVVNEATSRFSGAVWYNEIQKENVILAGCGGIGSWVALLLGRLNIDTIVLYDDDTIETVNMSGQFFGKSNIGVKKVYALADNIRAFTDQSTIITLAEKFTSASTAGPVMICGFDNMTARKTFFNSWYNYVEGLPEEGKSKCLFIDGRLNAEEFQVLCIKGDDAYSINRYRDEYLFNDREADETVCSYKQTSFMANMIASVMVNLFVNFIANRCDVLIPRDLPFFTEYTAETMFFKVIA